MNIRDGLTFDDVLLVPRHSDATTRDIPLKVDLGKGVVLDSPIVSANMKNVTGEKMAREIGEFGGLALLHRFASLEEQIQMLKNAASWTGYGSVGCSVGVKEEDYGNVGAL